MELDAAVVLITGGAGGIGSALADRFRAAGSTVVSTDLPGCGADVDLDVTDAAAVVAAVGQVMAEHGRLDVTIANAGVGIGGLIEDIPADDWRRAIDVNVLGVVNTVLPSLAHMRAQGHGRLVLMASVGGLAGLPLLAPYSMTKFAIVGLGASLRAEVARHGVGVSVVCPGTIDTPMLDTVGPTRGIDTRRYLTAAGGKPVQPDELAGRVVTAVRRDRPMVVPGRAGLIWRLARWAPKATDRQLARSMRKELDAAGLP